MIILGKWQSEDDFYEEVKEYMSRPLSFSVTTEFKLPRNQLERRAFLRLVHGFESGGSLIHNGKKRRK